MKAVVGAVALLAVAWVLATGGEAPSATKPLGHAPSNLGQLGEPDALRSLVAQRSPAMFRQWEVDFQQRLPVPR